MSTIVATHPTKSGVVPSLWWTASVLTRMVQAMFFPFGLLAVLDNQGGTGLVLLVSVLALGYLHRQLFVEAWLAARRSLEKSHVDGEVVVTEAMPDMADVMAKATVAVIWLGAFKVLLENDPTPPFAAMITAAFVTALMLTTVASAARHRVGLSPALTGVDIGLVVALGVLLWQSGDSSAEALQGGVALGGTVVLVIYVVRLLWNRRSTASGPGRDWQ